MRFVNASPQVSSNTIEGYNSYPLYQEGTSFPVYSGNTIQNNIRRGIGVSGTISSSGAWVPVLADGEFMVYEIVADLTISSGATLTIPAGTVVKFQLTQWPDQKRSLFVEGVLDVQGTAGSEVVFTSESDDSEGGDSNGDGGASSPSASDWGYIRVTNSANTIDYCRIKYGGFYYSGDYNALWISGVSPAVTVQHCTFQNCYSTAIRYDANTSFSTSPVISDNVINNTPVGIYISGNSTKTTATISGNTISEGSGDAIHCESIASGSTVTGNTVRNHSYGIYCSNVKAVLSNNMLSQSGSYVNNGIGVYIRNQSDVEVTGNTVQKFAVGLSSEAGSGNPPCVLVLTMNRFLHNGDKGLSLGSTDVGSCTGPQVTINDNDIYGNNNYALYLGDYQSPSTTTIDVENNWWGTTIESSIEASIFDHNDNPSSPTADYAPYRSGPIQVTDPEIRVEPAAVKADLFPDDQVSKQLLIHNDGVVEVLSFYIREAVGGLLMSGVDSGTGESAYRDPSIAVSLSPMSDVPWLSEVPTAGNVLPQESATVTVEFNSAGRTYGHYAAYLIITSNDPDEDLMVVPVSMDVSNVFLQTPDGGEDLSAEQDYTIAWTTMAPATVNSIDLLYSTDAGNSFASIANGLPNTFSYEWHVPSTPSESCMVRVIAHYAGGESFEDSSDAFFSIECEAGVGTAEGTPSGSLSITASAPNPFRSAIQIQFSLAGDAEVDAAIYDVNGRLVAALMQSTLSGGAHSVWWDGRGASDAVMPEGLYFLSIKAGGEVVTRKVVVIR